MYITFGVLQATVLVVGVFGCIFSDPVGKRKKGNVNDALYQMFVFWYLNQIFLGFRVAKSHYHL